MKEVKDKANNQPKGISRFFRFFFKTRKRKIITLVLILAIGFVQFRKTNKAKWEVDSYSVSKNDLVESISASGTVSAEKYAELSFLSSEIITEINADDGSQVKKGEVIAKQDTTNLYYAFQVADANLRSSAASLNSVYDDLKDKKDSETFAEISTRTTAETTKDKAVFNYVIAQKNLAGATIRAPFTGLVNIKSGVSVGKYATAAAPSFTLVDPSTVYLEAEVNELDIIKIKQGQKVNIELDAYPEESFEGQVESIGFVSVSTTTGGTAYNVRISLPDNSDNKFRVGMNGDAQFVLSKNDGVLTVPQSAVSGENGSSYVWTIDSSSKTQKKEVQTGVSSINDIEITQGLTEGEKIIVRPPGKIQEGDKVQVKS